MTVIQPKVTIVVPNYNHEPFLKKRMRTIIDQSYQDFEVIVIDDASTDRSVDVIKAFLSDHRIELITNRENSGNPFVQWNVGIQRSRGEYIWIAESDDFSDRNFLSTLVSILDKNTSVGLSYCQSWLVDESDTPLKEGAYLCKKQRWQKDFINDGQDECRNFLCKQNTIPNASAVLIRKKILEKIGYADTNYTFCGDWITWVKLLSCSDVAFCHQPLNYFRVRHANSVRNKVGGTDKGYLEMLHVLKKMDDMYALTCATKQIALFDVFITFCTSGLRHRPFRKSWISLRTIMKSSESFYNKRYQIFSRALLFCLMIKSSSIIRRVIKKFLKRLSYGWYSD